MDELTVSVLQWDVRLGEHTYNRKRAKVLIEEAVSHGAQVVLMPELCNAGYVFETQQEAEKWAEEPGGKTEKHWAKLAKRHGVVIAGGIAERTPEGLYNSLVVIGPEGELGRYRKTHLFDREKLFFLPGQELQVIEILGVPVGLMICYDGWFSEVPRALTLRGAQVILAAGCWIGEVAPEESLSSITMHQAHAYTNSIYVACAVRSGVERGMHFTGRSCLLSPYGMLGEPAPIEGEAVLTGRFYLPIARQKRRSERVDVLGDRRPELYESLSKDQND